jgi:prepilin-type N-terminal cleavage/methylation domain-containing protein
MYIKKKGFTLIELLVVVAIIGILAIVVLNSLSSARARARDSKRLLDIKNIQTALEVYYLSNNVYPIGGWSGSHTGEWENLANILRVSLPTDPTNTSTTTNDNAASIGNYVYSYYATNAPDGCRGHSYMIVFNLEGRNGDGQNDGMSGCPPSPPIYDYGNSFVVGVGEDGILKGADISGTNK